VITEVTHAEAFRQKSIDSHLLSESHIRANSAALSGHRCIISTVRVYLHSGAIDEHVIDLLELIERYTGQIHRHSVCELFRTLEQ
jgi:hypothetical protein